MSVNCGFQLLSCPVNAFVGAALILQWSASSCAAADEMTKLEKCFSKSISLPANASIEGLAQCLRSAVAPDFAVVVDASSFARAARNVEAPLRNVAQPTSVRELLLREVRRHGIDFALTDTTIIIIPRTYRHLSTMVYDLSTFGATAQAFLLPLRWIME